MSLYDLATSSGRTAEPVLIIKNSAGAAVDDPQNIAVFSNSSTGASVVLSPTPPMFEADDSGQPTTGGVAPPVVVNVQSPEVKTALTKIARFIPTETVTIYLGAVSASDAIIKTVPPPEKGLAVVLLDQVTVYWVIGLVITPLIFFLIWAIERSKTKKSLFAEFPYWKLSAAILAFLIWALAVPGNPYATTPVAKVAIAFVALLVSIVLDLIDQLYEARKMNAATT